MISLLAAADALSPKLVSLHGFAFGCRCRLVFQACLSSYFRSWLPLPACLSQKRNHEGRQAWETRRQQQPKAKSAAALSPKLVSFHDFALGCRCRLVSPSSSPFILSLLAVAAALSPKLVSLTLSLLAAAESCLPS